MNDDAKTDEMRSIIIIAEGSASALETVQNANIGEWTVEPLGIDGGVDYCFKNGSEKIAIHESENKTVITTSNVLPYDNTHDQDLSNGALIDLSKALDDARINNNITASTKDLSQE